MNRFELGRVLGEGMTGIVYEATDRVNRERVAMKVLKVRDAAARELRALGEIRHPSLVHPREVFEDDAGLSYTMDLVEGRNVLAYVRREDDEEAEEPTLTNVGAAPSRGRAFDEERVRSVAAQLAHALAALHERGVLHRDVKPSNILVTSEGTVRLLDYGFVVVGTAAYMAPENAPHGPPADVYAMGVVLFEMLTGELPFRGLAAEVLMKKRLFDAPPPRALRGNVPADLDALCQRLLARAPQLRPTAPELAAAFRS